MVTSTSPAFREAPAVAQPCRASTKCTPLRPVVPDGGACAVQVSPASEVVRITPLIPAPVPTAQPFVALTKLTPTNAPTPSGIWLTLHVAPPSFVASASASGAYPPLSLEPTAQPWFRSTNDTAARPRPGPPTPAGTCAAVQVAPSV